jgi:hypothetical protein
MVRPRPALRSPAVSTRYSLSISGNTIRCALLCAFCSAPAPSDSGSSARKRCTMRKICSAASWVCATCTVTVPGCVIVRKKNCPAIHVLTPIWRALSTMFLRLAFSSYKRCAGLAARATLRPSRFLILRTVSASARAASLSVSSCSPRWIRSFLVPLPQSKFMVVCRVTDSWCIPWSAGRSAGWCRSPRRRSGRPWRGYGPRRPMRWPRCDNCTFPMPT